MLLDVFPSTSNNSEAKANQVTWDLEKAIFQSVAVCTTMYRGTLDILQAKLFCFDPPWIASASPPQPLSIDEDQWSWLTSDLNTVFNLFFFAQAEIPNNRSYHLFASRWVYTLYLLQYCWLFPIPFIYAVVQRRRAVANTISVIILTRTE